MTHSQDSTKQIASQKLANLKSDIEKHKRKLAILQSQERAVAQSILDGQQELKSIAENLGKWQKELEQRDKEVSLREARVGQKEDIAIKSSNLLTL